MITLYQILFLILILVLIWIAFCGWRWCWGPLSFFHDCRVKKRLGNSEIYNLENIEDIESNILENMTIFFLGSSVTKGASSLDISFVDYIGKRNNAIVIKEAVSGSTLVNQGANSYIERLKKFDGDMDLFICQLSTNDVTRNKKLGKINDSFRLADFDTSTITGSIEFIICYVKEIWNCPILFYTNAYYDSELYSDMVKILYEIKNKWSIGIIDLWNNEKFNNISKNTYESYMSDSIHPTKAGYLLWWTSEMEHQIIEYIENIKGGSHVKNIVDQN